MVLISDFKIRQNADGENFVALILKGSIEPVKSVSTGKYYFVCRQCSIPSTLDEQTAKLMIGTKIPGEIRKVSCPVYDFTTSSGEIIQLDFSYQYVESTNIEEKIFA